LSSFSFNVDLFLLTLGSKIQNKNSSRIFFSFSFCYSSININPAEEKRKTLLNFSSQGKLQKQNLIPSLALEAQ
jgi:hypothetical protein